MKKKKNTQNSRVCYIHYGDSDYGNLRKRTIINIVYCHFLSILHNFKNLYKVPSILKVLLV